MARRRAILLCALLAATASPAATTGIAYIVPELLATDELSLSRASLLATVPTVGLMLGIIPWGIALDRHGERRILLWSLGLTLVGTGGAVVVAAAGWGYPALAAALFVGGLGSGAANGAGGRLVVGWFPPAARGTAMGVRQMAQPLGIAACALTMPVLAAAAGPAVGLIPPAALAAAGLVASGLGVVDPPRPVAAESEVRAANPYRRGWFLPRVHSVSVLLVLPQALLWTFVPTWLIVAQDWSPLSAGALVALTQALGALGRIVVGRISDRVGSRMGPVRAVAAVAAVSLAALAVTDWFGSPLAAAVVVVATAASTTDNALAYTAIAEYAGPGWSGRGLGVQNTAQHLAIAATTPMFGGLIAAVGFPAVFALAALAPVVALPVVPRDPAGLIGGETPVSTGGDR